MSLAPTREDTGVTIIYEKVSGDGTMPNNITCWVETLPMVRGVCRKKIHIPLITPSGATTANQTSYRPIAGYNFNLTSAFKISFTPMMRANTYEGYVRNQIGDNTIRFDTTAINAVIQSCDLNIETLTY